MAIYDIRVKDLKIYILFAPILIFYISISKYLKLSIINIIQYKNYKYNFNELVNFLTQFFSII